MQQGTKIRILLLPRNLTTAIRQPEASGNVSARSPKHHNTGFVRSQVDFHIEKPAEYVKDVQKLLRLGWVGADQRDVVSVHNVRDPQTAQDRACTWELQLDEIMQHLNEQTKQQRAELTTLLGTSGSAHWLPEGAVHRDAAIDLVV
jgi:hypothetical protein